MEERPTSRNLIRSDQRDEAYRRALDACARVAREEFGVATEALREAEEILRHLIADVGSVARAAAGDGVAIADARARLREIKRTAVHDH